MMRKTFPILLIGLALAGCGNKQADALDRAAGQSDPAAAASLHNQADAIRDGGSDANMSAGDSPAQEALQQAGNAAAHPGFAAQPQRKPVDSQTGLTR